MTVNQRLNNDIDDTAVAIKSLKTYVREAAHLSDLAREKLDRAEGCLQVIEQKGFFSKDEGLLQEIRKIALHIDRLRELRNTGEIGSFSLSVTRIADIAWLKLP